jgi:hypothetical protein
MTKQAELYERDFLAWTQEQAALLKANRLMEIDAANSGGETGTGDRGAEGPGYPHGGVLSPVPARAAGVRGTGLPLGRFPGSRALLSGGDQFAVVSGTDGSRAGFVVERLRAILARLAGGMSIKEILADYEDRTYALTGG